MPEPTAPEQVIGPTLPEVPVVPAKPNATKGLESRENNGKPTDLLIVFGQGPVKPILLKEELTEQQQAQWEAFNKDPLRGTEPDFRVVDGDAYINQLKGLDLTQAQAQMAEWQKLGRFALNRWGRQNSLAAGVALVSGQTEKVILSGGKTIPDWAKNSLSQERLDAWPSEAELMRDVIVRRFGDGYFKKFGRKIEDAISIEGASTNTLENFAYTLNHHPELFSDSASLGLLGSDFHLTRISKLAELFGLADQADNKISSQAALRGRAVARGKEKYKEIVDYMLSDENPDLVSRKAGEERWQRGINDPEFVTYWLGYVSDLENPKLIQDILNRFNNPDWVSGMRGAFSQAGLSFDEWTTEDLTVLQKTDSARYAKLMDSIRSLKSQRKMPPVKVNI